MLIIFVLEFERRMKILLLDNYDSYTYNLYHLIKMVSNASIEIFKNDQINLEDIKRFDKIVFSPGPGLPKEAGKMMSIIENYASEKSMLGVCLGHQAIAEVFGCQLVNTQKVYHGVDSYLQIIDQSERIFKGLSEKIKVGRYHSWVVDENKIGADIKITAITENQTVMAIAHSKFDVKGVQFHPESFITDFGKEMMKNWLND